MLPRYQISVPLIVSGQPGIVWLYLCLEFKRHMLTSKQSVFKCCLKVCRLVIELKSPASAFQSPWPAAAWLNVLQPYRVSFVLGVFRRFVLPDLRARLGWQGTCHQAGQICRSQVIDDFENNEQDLFIGSSISQVASRGHWCYVLHASAPGHDARCGVLNPL